MWKRRTAAAALAVALLSPIAGAANIPRQSPELAINTVAGGKPVRIGSQKGKVVAMIFILTYCAHCQKTIEALTALQKEYGPKGFQTIASAIEDTAKGAVPDFIKRYNPPFPVGYNDRTQVLEYLQIPIMNRLLMPQMALIDRQGVIRAQFTGDDDLFNEDVKAKLAKRIEPLLREPAAPARKAAPAGRKSAPTRGADVKKAS
jgi:thiol-disulfide isomerase/thioredoxin